MKKWMAISSLFLSLAAWQASAEERSSNAVPKDYIPDTGESATLTGQRILLFRDRKTGLQTWKSDIFKNPEEKVTAITDHGVTVNLSIENPDSDTPNLIWSYADKTKGLIQIVITRALRTRDTIKKLQYNCIPIVTVRNLTSHGMFRIVAEMEYIADKKAIASGSSMFGPLDKGEVREHTEDTLYDADCGRTTAKMHIPFCQFTNGLDCKNFVVGSNFGAISVSLDRGTLSGKARNASP